MNEIIITTDEENIKNKIFTIRGLQVMLDRDLAELYEVETRALKQAVKRNIERFPDDFMFELRNDEIDFMVSQSVIPSKQHLGGAKPFAFTEQGVSALSSVLTSKVAIEIHINIIRAFVNMRKFISNNALIFQRLETLEQKQFSNDEKFNKIFEAIEAKSIQPTHLELDIKKHNTQYPKITLKKFDASHDRFLILDGKELYHIGASLKDLGKKWFAFSKFDMESFDILKRLEG